MPEFKLNVPERKTLVRKMEELTGIHPYYTRTPRCAFEIGAYTVERDGRLVVEETAADRELLRTLVAEGLILDESGWTEMEETVTEEPAADEPTEDSITEIAEETAAEEIAEPDEPDGLEISLPIGEHTGTSLRNLVNLIYSRGKLINKALGTHFTVSDELADALKDDACTYTVQNFCKALEDFKTEHGNGLKGLRITAEKITFMGFELTDDADYNLTCTQLCDFMNRQVITQKRIQLRPVDDTNEKYAMRIWLVRIGMGGEEYKTARRVLLENLSGHCAFRTPQDAERAKIRNKAKRDRAKTEAATQANVAENETAEEESASETAENVPEIASEPTENAGV